MQPPISLFAPLVKEATFWVTFNSGAWCSPNISKQCRLLNSVFLRVFLMYHSKSGDQQQPQDMECATMETQVAVAYISKLVPNVCDVDIHVGSPPLCAEYKLEGQHETDQMVRELVGLAKRKLAVCFSKPDTLYKLGEWLNLGKDLSHGSGKCGY